MGSWTRERICELARGGYVRVRDAQSGPLPVPDWLLEVGHHVDSESWRNDVSDIHPADRAEVIRRWWQALERPGEAIAVDYRSRKDDGIHFLRGTWVNLLEDWFGAVLVVTADLDLVDAAEDWRTGVDTGSASVWAIGYLDQRGVILRHEGRIAELYGQPDTDFVGRLMLDFIDHDHQDEVIASWLEVVANPEASCTTRYPIVLPDGTRRWVESTLINRLSDPRIEAMMAVVQDITERRAGEEGLRRSQEQFRVVAEHMPTPVFRIDEGGVLDFANRRWFEVIGDAAARLEHVHDAVHSDDRERLRKAIRLLGSPNGPDTDTLEVRDGDGSRTYRISLEAVGAPGGDTRRPIVGSLHDITDTAVLRHRVEHDPLTGLLNRAAIDDDLDRCIREGASAVVAFVDLDRFKHVNDSHGHQAGDHVLRAVAARLRRAVRPGDAVGRHGGDEFVLVFPDASAGAEEAILRRIVAVLEPVVEWDGGVWSPSASVGFARSQPGDDVAALLSRADAAMYRAKSSRTTGNGAAPAARPSTGDDGR